MAGPNDGASHSKSRGSIVFPAIMLVFAAIFMALGIWQVQRLSWKLDLIQRVEARVHAPSVEAPGLADWPTFDPQNSEYSHVSVTGRFAHEKSVLVQAVTERGAGFWVVTPFERNDGTIVIINRGFVPPEQRDPTTRAAGNVAGEFTVTGLLRLTEPGGAFLRSNDPAADRWFSRDVAAIAQTKGLSTTAPYFIDADATENPGGLPVGGMTVIKFKNTHLVYALTWFSLAAMSIAAAYAIYRRKFR